MKYLDLSGLEHLIGRLIQWRSTDWTINVDGTIPTVVAPSVADNTEFWSKIAAGDSVTLTFSNGDPTRKAFVISVDRDRNTAILVAGTSVKLTQYVLRSQGGSMVLKGLDIPNASDVNSKLTASGTTEDLTVDTEGNLGLSYGDGFIERLCKDLGKTEVAKDALKANGLLGYGLGLNSELGETLATGNPSFVSALASNDKFCSELAYSQTLGQILAGLNQTFIETLAFNTGFYSALIANRGFCSRLAEDSIFCSDLIQNSNFGKSLAGRPSFYATLAVNSGFRDSLISNLSTAQLATLKKKLGV